MSTNFDWQSDDELFWDEPVGPGRPAGPRWPSRLALIVLVTLLGLLVWILGRAAQQRIETATADATGAILASHNLVRAAAAQGDVELFRTVLSGRSLDWMANQVGLAEAKLLFDRSAFGLALAAPTLPARLADIEIELSPELQAAEVAETWSYEANLGQGVTETIRLQQTSVYRRGENRWLLSPPEPEFWGQWRTLHKERISVTYPQRDEAIAQRLGTDLDLLLNDVCRRLDDLACPADLHLHLRLETDPATLLQAADLEATISSGTRMELPAPTLVGRPLDDAGYQALRRGYSVYVAAAAITEVVGYECCRHGLFYRILLDKQLSRLGLSPWPLTPAEYEHLLALVGGETSLAQDWLQSSPALATAANWRELYSIVDFILEEGGAAVTLAAMQRHLSQAGSFRSWRNRFLDWDGDGDAFTRRWLAFIYAQTPSGRLDTPPLAWPEPAIQLVCSMNRRQTVYQYDPATETWSEAFAYDATSQSFPAIKPLPGGEGYVIEARHVAPGQAISQLLLRRPGQEVVVFEAILKQPPDFTSVPGMYFTGLADPTGRYLVLSNYYQVPQEIDRRLLDLRNCDQGRCELQPLSGWPVWSPDGARMLIIEPRLTADPAERWRAPLFLAGARGQASRTIGSGHSPFWLDKDHYGYVRQQETSSEVVVAGAGANRRQVLLQSADLLGAIPDAARPEHLFITWVVPNPADAGTLLVYGLPSLERPRRHLLFFVERSAGGIGDVSLLFDTDKNMNPWFSPDGRWLTVVHDSNRGDANSGTFLVNVETRQVQHSFTGLSFNAGPESWSADGRWFLHSHGHHAILLSAPGYDYQKLVTHDFTGCSSLFWVNK